MIVPTLESERLILREPQVGDLDAMVAFFADDRSQFVGGPLESGDVWRLLLRVSGQWQLRGFGMWQIILKETNEVIGSCGLLQHVEWPEPELGYFVFSEHEGQGIAFEAVQMARQGAANLGVTAPASFVDPNNTRSLKLLERLGATYEKDIALKDFFPQVWRHPHTEAEAE